MDKIIVPVEVTDNGTTAKVNKNAEILKKNLEGAQRAASQTSAVMSASKATTGTEKDKGLTRGASGVGGGSEGKDFARQAQGLGGLVHVYATFAANIFAVSAAFTALSKAADYTNMIEGLNQLGAASGKNLGSMAKHMTELADGAITLKDAMEATAQGSAAGLTGTMLERLTLSAKKASQALGRDMGDSLSRLSRGIVKVEPELLDELGIMVRVDKATADYARTLGKSVTSLTDFERRMGFANAVLDQAEKKFGAINIEANPYNKLQATFVNLLLTGGELVNKVLGPIARLLGESPVALATVMTGITAMLLSKAIPALKGWRDNIKEAAEESKKITEAKITTAKESRDSKLAKIAIDAKAAAELEYAAYDKAADAAYAGGKKKFKAKSILEKPPSQISQKELDYLDRLASKTDKVTGAATKMAQKYSDAAAAIRSTQAADLEALIAEKKRVAEKSLKAPLYTTEGQNQLILNRLQRRTLAQTAVSNAAEEGSTLGITAGWAKLKEGIDAAKKSSLEAGHSFGMLSTSMTYIKGTLALAVGALGTFMSAFGIIGVAITAVVGAWQVLDSLFNKSTKTISELTNSLETMNSALEGSIRTAKYIKDLPGFSAQSATSIMANTQSFLELSGAVGKVSDSLSDLFKENAIAGSGLSWASTIDFFTVGLQELVNIIPGVNAKWGLEAKITDSLSKSIIAGIENTKYTDLGEKFKAQMAGLFKLDPNDLPKTAEGINKLMRTIDISDINKIGVKFKIIAKQTGIDLSSMAGKLTDVSLSMEALGKEYETLLNHFKPQDLISKVGLLQMEVGSKLVTALKTAGSALQDLQDIASDPRKFNLLSSADQQAVKVFGDKMIAINRAVIESRKEVDRAETALAGAKSAPIQNTELDLSGLASEMEQNISAAEKVVNRAEVIRKAAETSQAVAAKTLGETLSGSASTFAEGLQKVVNVLSTEVKLAAISYAKTIKSLVLSGRVAAEADTKSKLAEIDIKSAELVTQRNMIIQNENIVDSSTQLRKSIEENTLALDKQNLMYLKAEKNNSGLSSTDRKTAESNYTTLDQSIKKRVEIADKAKPIEAEEQAAKKAKDLLVKSSDPLKTLASFAANIQGKVYGYAVALARVTNNLTKASFERKAIEFEGKISKEKGGAEDRTKILNEEAKQLTMLEENLKLRIESSSIYEKDLENQRESIAVRQEDISLSLRMLAIQKEARAITAAEATGAFSKEELNDARDKLNISVREYNIQVATNKLAATTRAVGRTKSEGGLSLAELQRQQGIYTKITEVRGAYNNLLRDGNRLTESEFIKTSAIIDVNKLKLQNKIEEQNLQQVINEKLSYGPSANVKVLEDELKTTEEINKAKVLQLELQAQYLTALAKTEDTMRRMEQGGSGDYIGALTANFSDKLDAMIKAAKSAGDTFNQGLITAIDNSIDELMTAVQQSTLTLKGAVKYVRNSLSDVFKNTASQLLKNTWKEALKGFMPKTDADKTLDLMYTSNKYLEQIAINTTKLPKLGSELGAAAGPGAEKLNEEQLKTAETIGTGFSFILSALTAKMGPLGTAISWLLRTITSFSLTNAIQGGSQATGILGTAGSFLQGLLGLDSNIPKGYGATQVSLSGDLMSSLWANAGAAGVFAKGGVRDGSLGLSQYSNSVVASPTTFAFAQGGTPNRGLMGEAGPEAIMPLKRDSMGNLGVSGTRGNTNNITINVSVDKNGETNSSISGGNTEAVAAQLGNAIKMVVNQELIKQTRPGGLLAR